MALHLESSFEKTRRTTQKGSVYAREEASSGLDQFRLSSGHSSRHYNDNRKDTKWSPAVRNESEAGRAQMKDFAQQQAAGDPSSVSFSRSCRWWCSIHGAQTPVGSRDHHHCPSSNKPSFIAGIAGTGTLQPFHYTRGADKSIFHRRRKAPSGQSGDIGRETKERSDSTQTVPRSFQLIGNVKK